MATETYKVIAQSSPAAATLTTLYTVPAATQVVLSTIIVANRSATRTKFRIAVSPAGAAVANEHYIAYDVDIEGNDMQEITLGVTLTATDVVRVYATLATLSFNAFGIQIT
jgi:hypothetical protein